MAFKRLVRNFCQTKLKTFRRDPYRNSRVALKVSRYERRSSHSSAGFPILWVTSFRQNKARFALAGRPISVKGRSGWQAWENKNFPTDFEITGSLPHSLWELLSSHRSRQLLLQLC